MKVFLSGICTILLLNVSGQFPERASSSELYHELLKAGNTASILYMAAHPDDENTRLIAYFENELHARTAYLALTRGSGGQNLIGTEIGSSIGILRTQELLAARNIDGGEQFFTRAVDFGYSKSADESFEKWGKEEILRDVVWVIRKFRPDIIVTRFPPTNYAGHGHHQASAILAEDGFELAANPEAFPDQLEFVDVWQPKRLYFNTSTWWVKDLEDRAKNSNDYLTINVGEYNPILGESYGQIAARSRSQHKSQGFGSDYPMGNQTEYLKYVKGERVEPGEGILTDISSGWNHTSTPEVGTILEKAIREYDFTNPVKTAPLIIEALRKFNEAETDPLLIRKKSELEHLLRELCGLEMEATCEERFTAPGETLMTEIKINVKTDANVKLNAISAAGFSDFPDQVLKMNDFYYKEASLVIEDQTEYSIPYWLKAPYSSRYDVTGYENLGKPENDPALKISVELTIEGYKLTTEIPIRQKVVDPAKAVLYSPVYIVPDVTAGFEENTIVTSGKENKEIVVTAKAHVDNISGILRPVVPKGWSCEPPEVKLDMGKKGQSVLLTFRLIPSEDPERGLMELAFEDSLGEISQLYALRTIEYDHIPTQVELSPSTVEIIPIDLDRGGIRKIGYIEGPGDEVAKYLRAVGYQVEIIGSDRLIEGNFEEYDAIVTGIRAFNTRDELVFANEALNEYVKTGGTWLVQYNTTRGLVLDEIGPFPFKLSRERVTDESAQPDFLAPQHPVLHFPNEISESDFDGWVQERGLYFAGEWDPAFTPIIGWSDPEEPSREGGLIVAPHGEGFFVYSGISFFRELPAGVPGAYRLISNILALSKSRTGGNE